MAAWNLSWCICPSCQDPDLGLASSLWACLEIAGWWMTLVACTDMLPTQGRVLTSLDPRPLSSPQTCPATQTDGWPGCHPWLSSFLFVWVPWDCNPLRNRCAASPTITPNCQTPCPCRASHSCCFLTEPGCQALSRHYWVFEHRTCMWVLLLQVVLEMFFWNCLWLVMNQITLPPHSTLFLKYILYIFFFFTSMALYFTPSCMPQSITSS